MDSNPEIKSGRHSEGSSFYPKSVTNPSARSFVPLPLPVLPAPPPASERKNGGMRIGSDGRVEGSVDLLKTGVPFLPFSLGTVAADVQRPCRLATGFPMASPNRFLTPTLTLPPPIPIPTAPPLRHSPRPSSLPQGEAAALFHLLPFFPLSFSSLPPSRSFTR